MNEKEGRKAAYRILMRKPESKGPLGRPKCRWKKNIKVGRK
jgi:hypothetical protein